MTDATLLAALLASDGLDARTRDAFERMTQDLPKWGALTLRQRQWAQSEAHRLGLAVSPCDRPERRQSSAWDPAPKRGRSFPR